MRKSLLMVCLLAASCAGRNDPPLSLDRQLAGHRVWQQKQILRLNCLNGAERITPFVFIKEPRGMVRRVDSSQMRGIKRMCENLSVARPATAEKFASECSGRLADIRNDPHSSAGKDDLARMQAVCNAMTAVDSGQ